jgi:hypothetical protein
MVKRGLYAENVSDAFVNVSFIEVEQDYEKRSEKLDKEYHPLQIDEAAGQQLMDELYRAGIRPTEGMGSAGSMAAAQEHLKTLERQVVEVRTTQNRLLALVEKAWEWGREK